MNHAVKLLVLPGNRAGLETVEVELQVSDKIFASRDFKTEIQGDLLQSLAWEKHKPFCLDESVVGAKASNALLTATVANRLPRAVYHCTSRILL